MTTTIRRTALHLAANPFAVRLFVTALALVTLIMGAPIGGGGGV